MVNLAAINHNFTKRKYKFINFEAIFDVKKFVEKCQNLV